MKRVICPPAPRPVTLDAQPNDRARPFYALRRSLGDWTTGPTSEWMKDDGCLWVTAK